MLLTFGEMGPAARSWEVQGGSGTQERELRTEFWGAQTDTFGGRNASFSGMVFG